MGKRYYFFAVVLIPIHSRYLRASASGLASIFNNEKSSASHSTNGPPASPLTLSTILTGFRPVRRLKIAAAHLVTD